MAHNPTRIPLDQEHVIGDPNVVEYTYPFVAAGADASGQSDIRVAYDGEVIAPTNYRVVVNPGGRGGTVTFLTAAQGATNPVQLVQGRVLRIYRDTAVERVTSFGTGSYAPAAAVEAAMARLVRVVQELTAREDVRSTSLVEIFDIKPFARSPGQEGAGEIQPGDVLDAVKIYARVGGRAIEVGDLGFSLNPHAHSGGSITLADIASLIKAYAAAGGRAIALGDTDFADDVEEAFVLSQTSFNSTTRVLTLGTQDGRPFTVAIPDTISAADIELLITAHERVSGAHWFEEAFRMTTKTLSTRETFQANAAVTLPGRPILPRPRFTGDDPEIQVRIGSGTYHTFRVAEILAKQDTTLPSSLDDTDSVSYEEGGVTTRIGWHAGDYAYVISRSAPGLQNISILERNIVVDSAMIPPASVTERGGVEFASLSEALTGRGTFKAIGPGALIAVMNQRNASETQFGTAEIATDTEAATGTDTGPRFLSPKQVKDRIDAIPAAVDATETRKGIVELASKTESDTGTDNTRAMTPLRVKERIDSIGSGFPGFSAHQDAVFDAFLGNDESTDSTTIQVAPTNYAAQPTASELTGIADSAWVFSQEQSPAVAVGRWLAMRVPVAEKAAVDGGGRDLSITESEGLYADYTSSGWTEVTSNATHVFYAVQTTGPALSNGVPEGAVYKVREYHELGLKASRIDVEQWKRALNADQRLAITQLHTGAGIGISVTSLGASPQPNLLTNLGTLNISGSVLGIIEVQATLSFTGATVPTNLRITEVLGGHADAGTSARLTGWASLSALRASTVYARATGGGIRVGQWYVFSGSTRVGRLRLFLARDTTGQLGYYLRYVGDSGRGITGSFAVSLTLEVDQIHQDTAAAGAANLPQTATVAEMQAGTERALRSMSPYLVDQAVQDHTHRGGARTSFLVASGAYTPPSSGADFVITTADADAYSAFSVTVNTIGGLPDTVTGTSRTNPIIVSWPTGTFSPDSSEGARIFALSSFTNNTDAWVRVVTSRRLQQRGRARTAGFNLEPRGTGRNVAIVYARSANSMQGIAPTTDSLRAWLAGSLAAGYFAPPNGTLASWATAQQIAINADGTLPAGFTLASNVITVVNAGLVRITGSLHIEASLAGGANSNSRSTVELYWERAASGSSTFAAVNEGRSADSYMRVAKGTGGAVTAHGSGETQIPIHMEYVAAAGDQFRLMGIRTQAQVAGTQHRVLASRSRISFIQ